MKRIVLVVILVAGLGAGAYYWKNGSAAKADEATVTLAKVERGPIRQIVATTGKVVSNLDVDIKCKASGTVVELPFDISDPVKQGDLLVGLDPVDMDRIVTQAEVSLAASQARLATARQNLVIAERNLKTDRDRAEAALQSAEMAAKDAHAKADRVRQLFEKQLASEEERDTAETSAVQSLANLTGAKIKMEELKTQEQALEVGRQNVKLAQTQVQSDQVALDVANDRRKDIEVRAPMDAVVTARPVQKGMIIASGVSNVGGGTSIMTLSDLSRIFVLASVDESDIGKVAVGQPASIDADAYPGTQFQGKVVRIASKGVNSQNVVTFEVKIEVLGTLGGDSRGGRADRPGREGRPDRGGRGGSQSRPARQSTGDPLVRADPQSRPAPDGAAGLIPEKKSLLKPEMTANIDIIAAERDDALLIPADAVSRQGRAYFASVPGADPKTPDRKPVEIGIDDGTRYELLGGLAEGDQILVRKGEAEGRWSAGGAGREGGRGTRGFGGPGGPMRMMSGGGGGRGR